MAITHIIGFHTPEELRENAADFQELGYATVQIEPSGAIQIGPSDANPWPMEDGKEWYLLIATKDRITSPQKKAAD